MKTNKSGYPMRKINGTWTVKEYTDNNPDPKARVFKSEKAAEREAKVWNHMHGYDSPTTGGPQQGQKPCCGFCACECLGASG